jgi:putative membrane protein
MNKVLNFVKGIIVGISSPMPVLSGGMVAFFLGVYDDMIEAVGNFFTNKEKRPEYIRFLLPLGGGVAVGFVLGILIFAKLFLWSMKVYPIPTYAFFGGLIIGSIPFILKAHHDMAFKFSRALVMIAGIAVVIVLGLFTKQGTPLVAADIHVISEFLGFIKITPITLEYALWMLLCGFLIAGAMVIPNFPGFALLIGMGEYHNLFFYADERMIIPLAFFGVGVIIGILLFSRIVSILLKKIPAYTFYFILGLIFASVVQIGLDASKTNTVVDIYQILWGAGMLIAGFVIAYLMSKLESYQPKKDKPAE